MKKAVALISAIVLCLSLCACGKADDYEIAVTLMDAGNYEEAIVAFTELGDYEDSAQKLEECENILAYNEADALFEAEAYEDALAIFTTLGDYKDSTSKKLECENAIAYNEAVSLIGSGKYEEARLIFETISEYKDVSDHLGRYKTIEITPENWSDYFEIIMVPYFDTFDRLEEISYKFVFNNEYKNIVVYGSGFTIEIAYKGTGVTASVEYDKENDTFTFGPDLPGWGGGYGYDYICTFTDTDFAKMAVSRGSIINDKQTRSTCSLVIDTIYHEETGNACSAIEHNIENIKGTIIIYYND